MSRVAFLRSGLSESMCPYVLRRLHAEKGVKRSFSYQAGLRFNTIFGDYRAIINRVDRLELASWLVSMLVVVQFSIAVELIVD